MPPDPVTIRFPDDGGGGVLPDAEIRRLAQAGMISDFLEGSLQGASYDLRLGKEYYSRGEIGYLVAGQQPTHVLEPGQFILLTSLECLSLPDDVVGHAGLISRWAQHGLISLFSPQIDPGFIGRIIVPLFNAGDAPVTVKVGDTMFTVEFVRTLGPSSKRWADHHAPLEEISAGVNVEMARPDLTELTQRLNDLQEHVKRVEAKYEGMYDESTRRDANTSRQISFAALMLAVLSAAIAIAIALLG